MQLKKKVAGLGLYLIAVHDYATAIAPANF